MMGTIQHNAQHSFDLVFNILIPANFRATSSNMNNSSYQDEKVPYPTQGTQGQVGTHGEQAPPPYFPSGPAPGPSPYPTQPQVLQRAPNYPEGVHASVVYAGAPVLVTGPQFILGSVPSAIECPHCHNRVVTETLPESGGLTWALCGLISLFGCFLGCCLIPFCIDECKDIVHRCPSCKQFVGRFRRI